MSGKEMIEITARVVAETEKAVLVTDDEIVETWLPKSQIEYDERLMGRDETLEFSVPEWLAIKSGLL
jgi:hypothetical protein